MGNCPGFVNKNVDAGGAGSIAPALALATALSNNRVHPEAAKPQLQPQPQPQPQPKHAEDTKGMAAGASTAATKKAEQQQPATAAAAVHSQPGTAAKPSDDTSCKHKYTIAEQLGKGEFGVVSIATDQKGQKFAIKTVNKRRAEAERSSASDEFCKDVRTEIEVLYHLGGHDNIVQLHEMWEDAEAVHLVMELCEGGDWFQRLVKQGSYSEAQAAGTMNTLLKVLFYCHSLGVVHRDVKPENILFTDDSKEATIKLSDFGLSAMVPRTALQPHTTSPSAAEARYLSEVVGSPYYVAPEVLEGRGYGKEVDIWSLGVVLYVVLCGHPPFQGKNHQQVFHSILSLPLSFDGNTWDHISSSAKDFLSRMLNKDPSERASIVELLSHPWLSTGLDPELGTGASAAAPVPDAVVARLHQFALMNRFKQEARRVLALMLPEEEVVGLLGIFKEMDSDGNGVLTVSELSAALEKKGIELPHKQAKIMMHYADLDNNSVVDYEEFLAFAVHQLRLDKDELLFKAFRTFDARGSGYIARQQLQEALAHQGTQDDLDEILADIDQDDDGRINYAEFCNHMRIREQGKCSFGSSMCRSMKIAALRASTSVSTRHGSLSSLSPAGRAAHAHHTAPSPFMNQAGESPVETWMSSNRCLDQRWL